MPMNLNISKQELASHHGQAKAITELRQAQIGAQGGTNENTNELEQKLNTKLQF